MTKIFGNEPVKRSHQSNIPDYMKGVGTGGGYQANNIYGNPKEDERLRHVLAANGGNVPIGQSLS